MMQKLKTGAWEEQNDHGGDDEALLIGNALAVPQYPIPVAQKWRRFHRLPAPGAQSRLLSLTSILPPDVWDRRRHVRIMNDPFQIPSKKPSNPFSGNCNPVPMTFAFPFRPLSSIHIAH